MKKVIGLIILVLIIGGVVIYQKFSNNTNVITLKGPIGGEKKEFLDNPKIKEILRKKYGLIIDYSKAGSIEMVQGIIQEDVDFLWPSSQVALELFKMRTDVKHLKDEIIFNSPIVLYSWDKVTDALITQKFVEKRADTYFVPGFNKLIELINNDAKWSDIGITQLYGKIQIFSTDPSKSNSGNAFSGLVANILAGDVITDLTLDKHLHSIEMFFIKQGYMEHSSGDLFDQYLRTGMGAKPIIAGYESQIIEFSKKYSESWPGLKDKVKILYPEPTVWSSHPIIIIKEKAKVLSEALKDKDIQKIAWEEHGFRTGLFGVQNDPGKLVIDGIPPTIEKVIPMPQAKVMDSIIKSINNKNN